MPGSALRGMVAKYRTPDVYRQVSQEQGEVGVGSGHASRSTSTFFLHRQVTWTVVAMFLHNVPNVQDRSQAASGFPAPFLPLPR